MGNIYDFANSWALRSENKLCKRVQTPSSMCNVSSDIAEKVCAIRYHLSFQYYPPEGSLSALWQGNIDTFLSPTADVLLHQQSG